MTQSIKSVQKWRTCTLAIACACLAACLVGCDGGTSVKGTVQDSAQRPIADAQIRLTAEGYTTDKKSSGSGAFQIAILHSPGFANPELTLSVTKAGYRPFEKRFRHRDQLGILAITLETSPDEQETKKPQPQPRPL
jgi:hypothetical protein